MSRFTFIRQTLASVSCSLAALSWAQSPVTVTEYHNISLDAFFITGRANEQALLDANSGFRRTGMSFSAAAAAGASATLSQICRYYISTASPFVSSHFYGAQDTDCVQIAALKPAGFSYEGFDFATTLPGSNRACPASAPIPIRRAYRAAGGKTGNHRYATSQGTIDGMVALGWTDEGTTFCATAATTITKSNSQKNFEAFLLNGGMYRLRFGSAVSSSKLLGDSSAITLLSAEELKSQSLGNLSTTEQTLFATLRPVVRAVPTGSPPIGVQILTTGLGQTPVIPTASPPIIVVSYRGDNVVTKVMSPGASEIAFTAILSNIEIVPLAGSFANTPDVVSGQLTFLKLPKYINQTDQWNTDSAYMTATVTPLSDVFTIANCMQSVTSWTTPCANSVNKTLEQFLPVSISGRTLNFSDGLTSQFANGDRGWVATIGENVGETYVNTFLSSRAFRSYYQPPDRSGIYAGFAFRQNESSSLFVPGTFETVPLWLNKAAIETIGSKFIVAPP